MVRLEAMAHSTNPNERRFFDEKKIPSDVWSVLRTASLLSVGEFRVFEIAYLRWFGNKSDEATIETHFIPYMFNDVVPMWVRHFCNHILKLDGQGTLDPSEFGIVQRIATTQEQNRGYEFLIVAIGALFGLILLADWTAKFMKLQCMFPPCY